MATQGNIFFFLLFHGNNGYANAPQRYNTRTLPVLLLCTTEGYKHVKQTV